MGSNSSLQCALRGTHRNLEDSQETKSSSGVTADALRTRDRTLSIVLEHSAITSEDCRIKCKQNKLYLANTWHRESGGLHFPQQERAGIRRFSGMEWHWWTGLRAPTSKTTSSPP
jgi:hypothetical protein